MIIKNWMKVIKTRNSLDEKMLRRFDKQFERDEWNKELSYEEWEELWIMEHFDRLEASGWLWEIQS